MLRLFVFLSIVFITYIAVRYIRSLPPEQRRKALIKGSLSGLVVLLLFLALTGRLHVLAAVGAGLLLFIKKLFPFLRYIPVLGGLFKKAKASSGPRSGKHSTVETSLLRMTLDHDTGTLDGEVLAGPQQGKKLSELDQSILLNLYKLADQSYLDSTEILAAYLDRTYGSEWRSDAGAESGNEKGSGRSQSDKTSSSEMSHKEAFEILGLKENASKEEIIAAHRKLMQKIHPDRGGSDYLAAKVNLAKDLLLKSL
jgi:hypothetical protein